MKLRQLCLTGTAVVAIMVAAAPGAGAATQLGFILDESGSIGVSNWTTIVNGLSAAVGSIPLGGQYEVSVVTFATSATAAVSNFLVTDAASRAALQATITGLAYSGGNTNFTAAFNTMAGLLNAAGTAYVNFATDGVDNIDTGNTAAALANLKTKADNISVEGIGSGVDVAYLQGQVCTPQPCTVLPSVNFPAQGFYLGVADAAGYAAAIGNKIAIVTQVPEPMSLALFGMGLAGLGLIRRRVA